MGLDKLVCIFLSFIDSSLYETGLSAFRLLRGERTRKSYPLPFLFPPATTLSVYQFSGLPVFAPPSPLPLHPKAEPVSRTKTGGEGKSWVEEEEEEISRETEEEGEEEASIQQGRKWWGGSRSRGVEWRGVSQSSAFPSQKSFCLQPPPLFSLVFVSTTTEGNGGRLLTCVKSKASLEKNTQYLH